MSFFTLAVADNLLLIKYVIKTKPSPGHSHDRDAHVADRGPRGHLGERRGLTPARLRSENHLAEGATVGQVLVSLANIGHGQHSVDNQLGLTFGNHGE